MDDKITLPTGAVTPVRVLLVNPQPAVCKGVQAILESVEHVEIVGTTHDGTDALAQIHALRPDLVILACTLRDAQGAEVAEAIKRSGLRVSILVYSRQDSDDQVKRMLAAGALGYVLTTDEPELLVEAVQTVKRGQLFLSPRVYGPAAARVNRELAVHPPQLTPREREILGLVGEGLSNAEIAAKLLLGKQSVKNVVRQVYRKLGVHSRPQAILRAIQLARGDKAS